MIDIKKIIRIFIVAFLFMCLTTIWGMETRRAHELFFMLGSMILFGLLLRNVWLTLFLWWSVFLFAFFKCQYGTIYISNIFYGCVLYYLTRLAFKKEHIDFFVSAVLWVVFANLIYMNLQMWGFEFIYAARLMPYVGQHIRSPIGFMGNTAMLGMLFALSVPLALTRGSKWSYVTSLGLFVPFFIIGGVTNFLAAGVGFIFVLFFKIPKKVWAVILVLMLTGGIFFSSKMDRIGTERIQMWKLAMNDAVIHPVRGWGLDSFRNRTEHKAHIYVKRFAKKGDKTYVGLWDNPHNLYVSLAFEFSFISWFLLGGYLRQCGAKFLIASKEPNTLALAGFLLAFFIVSFAHFPMFLARFAVICIPMFGLYEVQVA